MALLLLDWLLGGVTSDPTNADEWIELAAIPVLLVAAWLHLQRAEPDPLLRAACCVLGLVVMVPLLQLLPLPEAAWRLPEARRALSADLEAAGLSEWRLRGSLSPAATQAALWALLPAVAGFLAASALDPRGRRWTVKALLALVAGNVLFGLFQVGLPADSSLRLFPSGAAFGGLFANVNHQASALVIGLCLAIGQSVHAWRRAAQGRAPRFAWLAYAGMAFACFLLVPVTTSRAGIAIALPAMVAAWALAAGLRPRRWKGSPLAWAGLAVMALVAIIGVRAAVGWMSVDESEGLRHALADATWRLGNAHAPWGSGIGTFTRVFEQAAPASLWLRTYVNHAHNEYAQWWLEGGVLAMVALAAGLAVLAGAGWRVVKARGQDGDAILASSCIVALCAVLAHSWADFPLRTLALMTTFAVLAGLVFGALADARRRTVSERAVREVGAALARTA